MRILWFGHQDYTAEGFSISGLPLWDRERFNWEGWHQPHRLLHYGLHGVYKKYMICHAAGVDELYRTRDSEYMKFCEWLIDAAKNFDAVVLAQFNPVHPQILKRLSCLKILGFVDDPVSTYDRGLVYIPAFDGVTYISPGYIDGQLMDNVLASWGAQKRYFLPLTNASTPTLPETLVQGAPRDFPIIYIGGGYGNKIDQLAYLRKTFGNDLHVYGRWRLGGFLGCVRPLVGGIGYFRRVNAVTNQRRQELYLRSKIAFNMHYTGVGNECGNMRTYEAVAHGCLLVSNVAAANSHAHIFKPDVEAIYYDSYEDAKDKLLYFSTHDDERAEIALNGYRRWQKDYQHSIVLEKFVRWLKGL